MGRCVTSGVRGGLGFRGDNSFALASRGGSDRCVRTCCCRWLLEVGAVAMCCGAVGVRRVHERLALGGWHCVDSTWCYPPVDVTIAGKGLCVEKKIFG